MKNAIILLSHIIIYIHFAHTHTYIHIHKRTHRYVHRCICISRQTIFHASVRAHTHTHTQQQYDATTCKKVFLSWHLHIATFTIFFSLTEVRGWGAFHLEGVCRMPKQDFFSRKYDSNWKRLPLIHDLTSAVVPKIVKLKPQLVFQASSRHQHRFSTLILYRHLSRHFHSDLGRNTKAGMARCVIREMKMVGSMSSGH